MIALESDKEESWFECRDVDSTSDSRTSRSKMKF